MALLPGREALPSNYRRSKCQQAAEIPAPVPSPVPLARHYLSALPAELVAPDTDEEI